MNRILISLTIVFLVSLTISGCGKEESDKPNLSRKKKTTTPKTSQTSTKSDKTVPEKKQEVPQPAKQDKYTGPVGHLSGVISFEGTPPKLPPLIEKGDEKAKDAKVCAHHEVPDESLIVDTQSGNGIANVFVYLPKAPKGTRGSVDFNPVVIDQKNCIFLPHAQVIRVGQQVNIKSDDDVLHNFHTYPLSNAGVNNTLQPKDRTGLFIVYEETEPIPVIVKCGVHTWMTSYQLVVDHPFVGMTDNTGRFEIENLPVGKYRFRIWHERANYLEKNFEVEIEAGETTEMTLKFPAEKF